MFKLYIGLDEERMERDGLNVEQAWEQINEMIEETEDIEIISKGELVTDNFGALSFLMMNLRDTEWFMKYINKWFIEDGDGRNDVIVSYKNMGLRCNYE